MATWDEYEALYKHLSPRMRAFAEKIAEPFKGTVEESNADDYGYLVSIEAANGVKIGLSFDLRDAGAFGDAEDGEKGNFFLSAVYWGGQIIIGYAPHNYTDECWVSYTDTAEFESRLSDIEAQAGQVVVAIQEAIEEKESADE